MKPASCAAWPVHALHGSRRKFFIYDIAHGTGTWGANTAGHPGAYATLQTDGNFVVYASNGVALWNSGTSGTFAERLDMEDDGRIIIYKSAWNSGTSNGQYGGPVLAHPGCDAGIGTGWTGTLGAGQCFVSPNGHFELLLQPNGNLVLYDRTVTPNNVLWQSGTGISAADPGFAMRTLYSYDALGNLLCVEQHGGVSGTGCSAAPSSDASSPWRVRRFTYDSLSRLLTTKNPESGTISYVYDNDGNLLQKTSPAPNQTNPAVTQTVSYCYDALHRVTGKGYGAQSCPLSSPVVSYIYDTGANAKGKLTSLTDQAGTASYTYDILGRMSGETRSIAGISKSTGYTYNLDGSIKTLTYPSGRVVTYTPDSAGRLISAVDGNGTNYVSSASYNPDGSLKGLLNGSTPALNQNFQYTPRLQLCRITALTTGTLPTSCTDTVHIGNIMDRGYDFHAGNGVAASGTDNGNIFGITNYRDANRSQAFTYDALNRLASGWSSANTGSYSWGETYSIDAWGNLQISPMGAKAHGGNFALAGNAQNRPTGLTYDTAGNLLSYLSSTYSYDQENRLLSTAGMTYTYDGNGERVLKSNTSTGAAVKRYWSMGGNTLAEGDGSGNLTAEYIYFGGKRIARIDLSANTVHYYLSDHLGSTSIVASATGAVEEESDYSPFGTESMVTGPGLNELKFTGKRRDTESQLDYFGARYYSNIFGRFATPDEPFADQDAQDPQSWNLYVYAANNSIRYNDPSGASHVDSDGWTVGDFHGELINNGTLYWNATDQVWTIPPLTDDQKIMQGATAIANLTSLESISDLGKHGINDAMLVEGIVNLPGALRSGAAFINSLKNGVRMAGVRAAGKIGESLVQEATGLARNTEQITSATGTASFRVPDVLNEAKGIIGEVKNINGKIYLSNQIKDDIAYAQAKGLTFKLFVRSGATFSGPLQNAIDSGAVTVVRF